MPHCKRFPFANALSAAGRAVLPAALLACVILVLWVRPASANAAPPPARMWFKLADSGKPAGLLQGAQLASCTGSDCSTKTLLQQYGQCDGASCLAGQPTATGYPARFECAEDTCLSAWGYQRSPDAGSYLQLILQYPDGVRVSQAFAAPPLNDGTHSYNWLVQVTDQGLSVNQSPDQNEPGGLNTDGFLASLVLTVIVEILVAALVLWQFGIRGRAAWRTLGLVAFIDLLTLPVVWLFFPSLGSLKYPAARTIGWITLLPLLYVAAAALVARVRARNPRIVLIVLLVLSLPLTLFVVFLALFSASYGSRLPITSGMAPLTILVCSEIFAVVAEAIMLKLLSRPALAWTRVALLSLLMNMASFGAGLALGQFFPAAFL